MKRTTAILLGILLLLLIYVGAVSVPMPGGVATYTPVSAQPSGYLHIVTNMVHRIAPWFGEAPSYFVEDGELYLRNQTTRHALVLVTFVSPGINSRADIEAFRREHPALEHYWPEPDEPDGGVAWTRERIANKLKQNIDTNAPIPQQ